MVIDDMSPMVSMHFQNLNLPCWNNLHHVMDGGGTTDLISVISPCYFGSWQITGNKSLAMTNGGTPRTWCPVWTRHINKDSVNDVIWQYQLWILLIIEAVRSLSVDDARSSDFSSDSTCFTEWHWIAQVPWRLACPRTETRQFYLECSKLWKW